jgi:YfdX protein
MKKYLNKMAICIIFTSGATPLCTAGNSFAKTETQKSHFESAIDRISEATKYKILIEKTRPIKCDAVEVELETQKAIVALENKDTKDALTILEGFSGKLDNILAKYPGLALVPVSVKTDVFDYEGDNKEATFTIHKAMGLLKHGKLPVARHILSDIASEIRVATTSIPLSTFPGTIKQVIALIESGKTDQAVIDLNSALDTLVVTTELIPLPVLRAEALLKAASALELTDDLSRQKNRKEIRNLIDAAKDKLELGELLGYGDKDDYKTLYQQIDAIRKTLFSEKSKATWQKIKNNLSNI